MRSHSSHIALWGYVWTWASAIATATAADSRFVLYLDQYHTLELPHASESKGINYVNVTFANSSLFTSNPAGQYTPFMSVSDIRLLFGRRSQGLPSHRWLGRHYGIQRWRQDARVPSSVCEKRRSRHGQAQLRLCRLQGWKSIDQSI
ncbi:hypothetical protein EDB81DRAFT_831995 [Dactylonectria macrodidyma]|uniref:Uncharacterized protein n=1 Tax=Dactylonectria macrodidyma TaxID=307937 RepID=A0A9P9D123_9HYPO|nr:hypothetical protein EDB81DRAFT_831995 [Dactylonectria macrodidyma]